MLNFLGFHWPRDGYGYATIKIAQQLHALSDFVRVIDMSERAELSVVPGDQRWELIGDTVALCTPDWLPSIKCTGQLWAHTMFEATQLPGGWAEKLNEYADGLIVPCAWCKSVFRDNGVILPIRVVRWGIAPDDYYPLARERDEEQPYTFLWSGTPDKRKGWDLAYRAFWQAFGPSKDVRLIMHFREGLRGVAGFDDENVEVVEGLFGRPELRDMLQRADCYIFPSRGEGWGLPPREAAATGLPVIATDYGGLAEEIDLWALPLPIKGFSQADYGYWEEDIGTWAEPDLGRLIQAMRACRADPQGAALYGLQAALWTREHATWERTARGILDIIS